MRTGMDSRGAGHRAYPFPSGPALRAFRSPLPGPETDFRHPRPSGLERGKASREKPVARSVPGPPELEEFHCQPSSGDSRRPRSAHAGRFQTESRPAVRGAAVGLFGCIVGRDFRSSLLGCFPAGASLFRAPPFGPSRREAPGGSFSFFPPVLSGSAARCVLTGVPRRFSPVRGLSCWELPF